MKTKNIEQFVYILLCSDNKPYTSCTSDIQKRLEGHSNGYVPATKYRRPLNLITYISFTDRIKAFEFEKYLKSGSGRAFLKKRLL